jgi:hypothetical protein
VPAALLASSTITGLTADGNYAKIGCIELFGSSRWRLLMFKIYQHGKKSDYRLIIPEGASLPSEAKQENWKLTKTVEKVSLEAEKNIQNRGYHLYKSVATFQEIEGV